MILQCRKCYTSNVVDDSSFNEGYEAFRCHGCLNPAFMPDFGLYRFMSRTIMNEAKAYESLYHSDEVFIIDGY